MVQEWTLKKLCIHVCVIQRHIIQRVLHTTHDAGFSLYCNGVAIAFKIKLLDGCIAQW